MLQSLKGANEEKKHINFAQWSLHCNERTWCAPNTNLINYIHVLIFHHIHNIYSKAYTMSVVYNKFPTNIINEFNELLQTY